MASDAKIVITADDAQVNAAMQRMANTVQEGMSQIQGQFAKVNESMGQIQGQFSGIFAGFQKLNVVMAAAAAVLGGGKAFKESVDAVKNMTIEANQLSKTLGISAEEANVLNTALGNVFLDKDIYIDATKQITKNLNSNSKAFDDLGIKTKDAQGNLLPMQTIINNTSAALMQFKEGADRNVMANQLLGKSWEDTLKLAKLTPEVMEAAAEEVRDYHKELDPAAVQRYREAMENVGDVFEGIKITIGQALMPILTKMGEWLSSKGVSIVDGFREVLDKVIVSMEYYNGAISRMTSTTIDRLGEAGESFNLFGATVETIAVLFAEACYFIETTVEAFKAVVMDVRAVLVTLFQGMRELALTLVNIVGIGTDTIIQLCSTFSDTVQKILNLDFSGVADAWDNGLQKIEDKFKNRLDKIKEITSSSWAAVKDAWKNSGIATMHDTGGNIEYQYDRHVDSILNGKDPLFSSAGSHHNPTRATKEELTAFDISENAKKKNPSRVGDWETELTEKKAALLKLKDAEGNAHAMTLEAEKEFWNKRLALTKNGSDEQKAVRKKIADADLAIEKARYEAGLAGYKTELEAANNNMLQKVAIAEKMAAYVATNHGKESKEYQEAKRQIIQIERQATEQIIQIQDLRSQRYRDLALAEINQAEAQAQLEVTLGQKTQNEMLAAEAQFEQRRYQIRRAEMDRKLQQYAEDPVKYQQTLSEIALLEQQYGLKRTQIKNKQAQEDMKNWNALESGMSSMFSNGLNRMLAGTLKFRDAMKQVWGELGKLFVQKMVLEPLAAEMAARAKSFAMFMADKAKELAVSLGFIQAETTAKEAGTATQTTTVVAGASTEIGAKGASGAAGAFSAMAAIPIVGPALALGAMAAALAAVLGLRSKLKSASGGYDIPAGINPVTQLHQEEMVLPAQYANVIRSMATGQPGNASGTNTPQPASQAFHFNITALDTAGVKKLLMNNKSAVHAALKSSVRNFAT